jgi:hypothetical protein
MNNLELKSSFNLSRLNRHHIVVKLRVTFTASSFSNFNQVDNGIQQAFRFKIINLNHDVNRNFLHSNS